MFLKREKQILNLLFKNQQKFTTSQIAAQLKVSTRTIKADIKKINEELEKYACSIQTKQGVGLWLDYSEDGEKFLKSILYEDQENVYLAQDTRKYRLAVELLLQKDYTSMENIANRFYISKGTVVNDFNELEDFWKKFELTFIRKVKYGIRIEGEEGQIRLALTEALKRCCRKGDRISRKQIQQIFEKVDLNLLKEIIQRTEERFQYVLTDVSFDEFLVQLAVMEERLLDGCALNDMQTEEEQEENQTPDRVAEYIRNQMENLLDIKVPESEKKYLKTCIQGHRYHVPMIRETEKSQIRKRAPEMFDYVVELLLEVDRKYLTELSGDDELVCSLFEHLECMVYRIRSKMFTSNPILNSIKKEMFFEYDIASYLAAKMSKKYQIEVTEDEIGYVAFHIGASIERLRQRKKENVRVTIICMSGIGSSQFVSMKLKRLFPELEVVQIISENRAETLKPETQDFVIATIPLTLENIKVITVSSLLNEADVRKIQEFIRKKKNPDIRRTASYFHLKQYLHENISILNCDLRAKEEVIQLLGGRMMREGFVDEGYVNSVSEREKVSETAVGSLLAIPHAFEGHIQKQGIGFMTLQRPILWGNEKVQVILMLALSAEKENDFQGIFEEVVEITNDPKLVDRILKVKRFDELKEIL